jgi:hypothetical protein
MAATEYATHAAVNPDNGRIRVFVASDMGLMDYQYSPAGTNPEGPWILRGQLHRWGSIKGLRLQTDAQIDEAANSTASVWRLVAEEPKIELAATSDQGERQIEALLSFARACIQHAR